MGNKAELVGVYIRCSSEAEWSGSTRVNSVSRSSLLLISCINVEEGFLCTASQVWGPRGHADPISISGLSLSRPGLKRTQVTAKLSK